MLNLEKSKKYVLACSFGPDSMALFSMLYNEGYSFVVAHVNYHKRDASNFEEESLRKYCKERNIEIDVLDAPHAPEKVNFQDWARELRYDFFRRCINNYECDAVLVAHQEDDFIETYLMQKERGSDVNFYGISERINMMGVIVLRPLLGFSKKELQEYDNKNNVPYSIDCSNLTNDYTRNKIRHEIVEKLSKEERQTLIYEANERNKELKSIKVTAYLDRTSLSVPKIKELPLETFILVIHKYLNFMRYDAEISKYFLNELKKALDSKKSSFIMSSSGLEFVKEYDELYVREPREDFNYLYFMFKPSTLKTEWFELDFTGDTSDRNISINDYPLKIRNANKNDEYQIGDHVVTLRRAFIDWKMPPSLRDRWPVVVNKNNKIIYVPRYRKDFVDNHKTLFKINVDKLKE